MLLVLGGENRAHMLQEKTNGTLWRMWVFHMPEPFFLFLDYHLQPGVSRTGKAALHVLRVHLLHGWTRSISEETLSAW